VDPPSRTQVRRGEQAEIPETLSRYLISKLEDETGEESGEASASSSSLLSMIFA